MMNSNPPELHAQFETASHPPVSAAPAPIEGIRVIQPRTAGGISMRLYRLVTTILLVFISLAVGVGGFVVLGSLKKPPARRVPMARPIVVTTYDVSRTDVREIVSVFGTSRAEREVQLTAQVAGQIVDTFKLNIGEFVQAPTADARSGVETIRYPGDTLITIDPQTYQERLNLAEARIKEDDAEKQKLLQEWKNLDSKLEIQKQSLATYQMEFDRINTLFQNGKVTASEIDRARLELIRYQDAVNALELELALMPRRVEQLDSRKATHESDISMAKLDLERTKVIPPFDGIISDRYVELGQFIRVGDPLIRIVDTNRIEIPVAISIEDHRQIYDQWKSERVIPVSIARHQDEASIWTGEIVRFAPVADERTRTIEVFVLVDNSRQATPLMPGTFVNVRIQAALRPGLMLVPRSAVVDNSVLLFTDKPAETVAAAPENSTQVARTATSVAETADLPQPAAPVKTARRVSVKTAGVIQGMAVIESGLGPDDRIVMTNLDLINELLSTGEEFTLLESATKTVDTMEADQRIRRWEIVPGP